jgi:hypothetical protein
LVRLGEFVRHGTGASKPPALRPVRKHGVGAYDPRTRCHCRSARQLFARDGSLEPGAAVLRGHTLGAIVVPRCGQLEYTNLCVLSLLKHTRQPFELIFHDIGSLDGTAEYLAGLASAAPIRVEMFRTATDLGIADAVQVALKLCRGVFVVLLNNDAVVTDAWLNQLVGLAHMTSAIGLVGPMSNYAAPPQLVEKVPYRIVGGGQWNNSGQWTVVSAEARWWGSAVAHSLNVRVVKPARQLRPTPLKTPLRDDVRFRTRALPIP